MIPYDDLVMALAAWRARQGLPVVQLSGSLTPPQEPARPPPPMTPARSAPSAMPKSGGNSAYFDNLETPPPLAPPVDEEFAVEESALLEEAQYESLGDDFSMGFGGAVDKEAEPTAIGTPDPSERDSFGGTTIPVTDPPPPKSKKKRKRDDW